MFNKIKGRIISLLLAGTVVLGSFAIPTTVMACDDDDDNCYYYGWYCDDDDEYYDDYADLMRWEYLNYKYEKAHSYVNVTGICVSSTAVQLPTGGRYQITGYVKPDNANNQGVCYYSTNPSVAVVDGNGVITALNPGTCYIVSKSSEGGYEAYTSLTVYPATYPIVY